MIAKKLFLKSILIKSNKKVKSASYKYVVCNYKYL
jgi:hypothetical protein